MTESNHFEEFVAAVEEATSRAGRPSRDGNIRLACPAHDDRNPSLSVKEGDDGRLLVNCHAGCSYEAILEAISWVPTGAAENGSTWTPAGAAEAVYDYVDEEGALLFQVCRAAGKKFLQRRPDPSAAAGWAWNLNGVRRVLYRLPDVIEAVARGERAYVCEGEKDVDAAVAAGATGTCNPGGAGKWRPAYAESFRGADVVVVADADDVGRTHAAEVAEALRPVANTVRLVEPAAGKDLSDHLAGGHGLDDLVPLELDAGPPTQPKQTKQAKQSATNGLREYVLAACDLFRTPDHDPFATFEVNGHAETWAVDSSWFKNWLYKVAYTEFGSMPTASRMTDLVNTLRGTAALRRRRSGGPHPRRRIRPRDLPGSRQRRLGGRRDPPRRVADRRCGADQVPAHEGDHATSAARCRRDARRPPPVRHPRRRQLDPLLLLARCGAADPLPEYLTLREQSIHRDGELVR